MPPSRPPGGALSSFSKKDVVAKNEAAMGNNSQSRWEPSDAELDELREFLAARPGDSLRLEMLRSSDPELGSKAKALMSRDGFVRIPTARTARGSSEAARCGRRSSRMR